MKTARITQIAFSGSFESQHGPMQSFTVSFDDGMIGQANAKSNPPAYKIGDLVGYEQTGDFKGTPKLKIDRNPQPAPNVPASQPMAPQSQSRVLPAVNTVEQPIQGQTVGMAINNALEVLIHGKDTAEIDALINLPAFWSQVHTTASDIIRVSRLLEHGKLAPSPKERLSPPKPAVSPAPAPRVAPPRNDAETQAFPTNQAIDPNEIPF